jgi:hypothetical protein
MDANRLDWWKRRSVFVDWWALMSGPLSAIFAALGALNVSGQATLWVILAAICTGVIIYRQSRLILFLQDPKLGFFCSPKINDCRMLSGDGSNCAYRIRVINHACTDVHGAIGRLTSISGGDGLIRWNGDSPQLSFTPSAQKDAVGKTLEREIPHTLDVLFLYRDDSRRVSIGTKIGDKELVWGHKPLHEIFDAVGDYKLNIVVSGSPYVHAKMILLFRWTGNYVTSELWLDEIEPTEARDREP